MASVSWNNASGGSWSVASNWSPTDTVPGSGDDAFIAIAGSYTVSLTATITVASLTISDASAVLQIQDAGGDDTVAGALDNDGSVGVDAIGAGGSTLTVGGSLTNSNYLQVGNSGMTAASLLTVGMTFDNTGGVLDLYGGHAGAAAQMQVAGAAPGTLVGTYSIIGDAGGATLQFGSGQIGTIASGAVLLLDGANALLANSSDTTTDSALDGLTDNAGTLRIVNGASVGIAGNLLNAGGLLLDGDAYSSEGGSALTVAGTLTNTDYISVGPPSGNLGANDTLIAAALTGTGSVGLYGSTNQASFDIAAAAPATLAFDLSLYGHSLLQYGSGQIGTIASNVTLLLDGPDALVADASATTSNSALTGLAENDGTLRIVNGASVGLTGNLLNTGGLLLDGDAYSSEGGSTLTVAGTLTNTGFINIGPPSGNLGANDTLIAAALTGTGSVGLYGSTNQATFDIAAAAPTTLAFDLSLYGHSLLQYGSGQVGTIDSNITLLLDGPDALIADASATGSNSALTGLTDNAGTLRIINGASVGLAGNLLNAGALLLDGNSYATEGGSTLTVAGTLTNTDYIDIGPPSGNLDANTTLIASALTGTGSVGLFGGGTAEAVFDIAAAAPTTLAFNLSLYGHSLLQYGSGQIGTVASNVTLLLDGPDALVADASTTTSDSALTGLAENDGTLRIINGASVGIAGNLLNTGGLLLDGDAYATEGGSTLTVAGTLTNTDYINVGPPSGNLNANTTLIASALTGTGSVGIFGGGTAQAVFDIAAAAPAVLAFNVSMFGHSLLEYGSGQIGTDRQRRGARTRRPERVRRRRVGHQQQQRPDRPDGQCRHAAHPQRRKRWPHR